MNLSALNSIYLFADFNETDFRKIAAIAEEKHYVQGQDFFTVGETASAFYVVLMGTVKLTVNSGEGDEIQIRNFGSGSHFGEMPFIDGEKRSASVQAVENCRVLEFPYRKLQGLLEQDPAMAVKFYRATARFLALRLRATTADLNQLRELKFHH